jgi:hypothetical protein
MAKRSSVRETYAVKKVGKRYAVVRVTKIGRVFEMSLRLSMHTTRLDAAIRLREIGGGA